MLNSNIILQGRAPDIAGSMAKGNQLALMEAAALQQADYRNALTQHGAGAASGDEQAINALAGFAQFGPQGAQALQSGQLSMDATRQGMAHADQKMAIMNDQAKRQASEYAMRVGAAQAAQEAAEAEQELMGAAQIFQQGDLRGLNKFLLDREVIPVPLGSLDEFPLVAAQSTAVIEALKTAQDFNAAPTPLSPAGKLATDLQSGVITQEQFDQATTKAPLVDMSGLFGGSGTGQIEATAPQTLTPPSGAQEAFGAQGVVKGIVNSVTDFLGVGEVFENAAEQTRFFQNMEEDLLVGLSQAYGRQPAQALMERLRKLVPNAGTLEGSGKASGEIQAMKRRFERDLRIAEGLAKTAKTPTAAQEAVGRMMGLRSALETLSEAEQRFNPVSSADQSDEDLMRQLLEGE